MKKWIFATLLVLSSASNASDTTPRESAIHVVKQIIGICEQQGMLACEPYIKGGEPMFRLVRVFDALEKTEAGFKRYLKQHYPDNPSFTFYVLDVSLNLKLNTGFKTEQFVQNISKVTPVESGYDLLMKRGHTVALRKQADQWHIHFPASQSGDLSKLEPLRLAAMLKRSILVYRMLEADMLKLERSELEKNVSEDIAPILVAMFGKDKVPSVVKWLVKDTNEVIAFYRQFKTVNDMKIHIRKTHNLD